MHKKWKIRSEMKIGMNNNPSFLVVSRTHLSHSLSLLVYFCCSASSKQIYSRCHHCQPPKDIFWRTNEIAKNFIASLTTHQCLFWATWIEKFQVFRTHKVCHIASEDESFMILFNLSSLVIACFNAKEFNITKRENLTHAALDCKVIF